MCVKMMKLVRDHKTLKGTRKAVMLALADRWNPKHDCSCWPSNNRIAEDTGLSIGTVKNATKDLEAWGFFRKESGGIGSGRGNTNVYYFGPENMRNQVPENGQSLPILDAKEKGQFSQRKWSNSASENGQPLATNRKANPKRKRKGEPYGSLINAKPELPLGSLASALSSEKENPAPAFAASAPLPLTSELRDGSDEDRTPREDTSPCVDDLPSEFVDWIRELTPIYPNLDVSTILQECLKRYTERGELLTYGRLVHRLRNLSRDDAEQHVA
jgi:hypothetical protein